MKDDEKRAFKEDIAHAVQEELEFERKQLAKEIVNEFWDRLSAEVGKSLLKKLLWSAIIGLMAVAYFKLPWK